MATGYTIENAYRFKWSSVIGQLNSERVSLLRAHLIGKRVLDAGCGGGGYVDLLSRSGFDAVGVDSNEQFLRLSFEKGFRGTFVNADIVSLPYADKIFDTTYCFDVLEHVDDCHAIRELARVTRTKLILAIPKEDEAMQNYNLTFLHHQDKTHLRNYTETSLRELLAKIDSKGIQIYPELPIFLKGVVRDLVDFRLAEVFPLELRYRVLRRGLRQILSLRLPRPGFLYQEVIGELQNRLVGRASYKTIYTSLFAVVDIS